MDDELESARGRKRLNEERAKMYYDKIRKQESEVEELQKQLTLTQRRLSDLQAQKADMDRRMGELQSNIEATNRSVSSLKAGIDGHRTTISGDQVEMEKYNAEVQKLDGVIANLMRRR